MSRPLFRPCYLKQNTILASQKKKYSGMPNSLEIVHKVENILLHPLFIRIIHSSCIFTTLVPDIETYRLFKQPLTHLASSFYMVSPFSLGENLSNWLDRRGLKPRFTKMGLIDPSVKLIYVVDMLVEDNRNNPVFIIWFQSDWRLAPLDRKPMVEYALKVQNVAENIFHFSPTVILINVYGSDKLSSHWIYSKTL